MKMSLVRSKKSTNKINSTMKLFLTKDEYVQLGEPKRVWIQKYGLDDLVQIELSIKNYEHMIDNDFTGEDKKKYTFEVITKKPPKSGGSVEYVIEIFSINTLFNLEFQSRAKSTISSNFVKSIRSIKIPITKSLLINTEISVDKKKPYTDENNSDLILNELSDIVLKLNSLVSKLVKNGDKIKLKITNGKVSVYKLKPATYKKIV